MSHSFRYYPYEVTGPEMGRISIMDLMCAGFTYEICTEDDCYLFMFELRKQARAEKSLG